MDRVEVGSAFSPAPDGDLANIFQFSNVADHAFDPLTHILGRLLPGGEALVHLRGEFEQHGVR